MIPAGAVKRTGGNLPTTLFPGEHAVKNLPVSGMHMVTNEIPKTAQTAKYNTASIKTSFLLTNIHNKSNKEGRGSYYTQVTFI